MTLAQDVEIGGLNVKSAAALREVLMRCTVCIAVDNIAYYHVRHSLCLFARLFSGIRMLLLCAMQIRKDIGWEPEPSGLLQTLPVLAADQQLWQHRRVAARDCLQLEEPVMPPARLDSKPSAVACLMQQCMQSVEVPDVAEIAVTQLTSGFDCAAEAIPLDLPTASDAALELTSLTAFLCREDAAPMQHAATAAEAAMLDEPRFAPLAVSTAACRTHSITAAIAAADVAAQQVLGKAASRVIFFLSAW